MSQRKAKCTSSSVPSGDVDTTGRGESRLNPSPNAFSEDFLDQIARREPAPATPEADLAGPWRVTALYGAGDEPSWGCFAAGEPEPRMVLDSPDLAYLAAAALAVAGQPPGFRFQDDPDPRRRRLHLLHQGHPVGTSLYRGDGLLFILSDLAGLRVQPLAFAHYLLSVPDETLRRSGRILMELLREAGR